MLGVDESCGMEDCPLLFFKSDIESARLSCFALSHSELDMVVLGQIMAKSNISIDYFKTFSISAKKYTKYFHQGKAVCPSMFRFLHEIGTMRLKNLVKHYKQNGLTPHTHGNTRRLPSNNLVWNTLFIFC